MSVAYYHLTEGMGAERRQEIDELLEGPTVTTRRERAQEMAAVGGEVKGTRRRA